MRIRLSSVAGILVAAGLSTVVAAPARGALITSSLIPPPAAQISQPDASGPAFNGSQDFTDNAGPPGQTFTTGPAGLTLNAIAVKGFANTGASFGGNVNTGTWTVTVSRVDGGTTLTQVDQETANPSAVTNGAAYLTITLDTPVVLAPNTQYAWDVFSSNGYFGLAKSSGDVYAGGVAMQHGATARTAANGATITNPQTVDRTFFINPVPEPSGLAPAALVVAGLLARRRARR
jgi:hypothetical protein